MKNLEEDRRARGYFESTYRAFYRVDPQRSESALFKDGKIFIVLPRFPETKIPDLDLLKTIMALKMSCSLPLQLCCFDVLRLEEPRPKKYATLEIHYKAEGEFPEVYFNGYRLNTAGDEFIHW